MKTTVSSYDFERAFTDAGRGTQFSYEGKNVLFEYLERLGDDCGTEYELDVIALCCEYTEYENLAELQANYSDIESMDDLQDHTQVIQIDDESFIIQDF